MVMRKGEVWWAKLPPPLGRRPVVLLSRDEAYTVRSAISVAEVTTQIRSIPVEVALGPEDGLPKRCVANLDTIVTIRKELLIERITMLRNGKAEQIDAAIRFALSIPWDTPLASLRSKKKKGWSRGPLKQDGCYMRRGSLEEGERFPNSLPDGIPANVYT
jgi:mRNA interferase MazF